ncbi:MAG: hypothetical protein HYX56_02075 [Chloroflexi bacterium]|nr:hypothetical protein [Chloroflexota bacterium]
MSNGIGIVACRSAPGRTERPAETGVALHPDDADLGEGAAHQLFDLRLIVPGHQERELVTWGRHLGEGLVEFRVRHSADEVIAMFTEGSPRREPSRGKVALRVFVHAHGEKLLLLLGGYDKAVDPSDRRQDQEIALARKRLREYRQR